MNIQKIITMRDQVKEELGHIPSSPKPQKDLRMVYWSQRMHSLGKKAVSTKSARQVLDECISYLRENGGTFTPKCSNHEFLYDKKYFQT